MFSSILDGSPHVIIVIDADLVVQYRNQAAIEAGCPGVNEPLTRAVPPQEVHDLLHRIRAAEQSGEPLALTLGAVGAWVQHHAQVGQTAHATYILNAGPSQERRLLTALDEMNRTLLAAESEEQLLGDALELLLTLLDSDRAYLIHPADPEAADYTVPMIRTRPGFEVTLPARLPMSALFAQALRAAAATGEAVVGDTSSPEVSQDPVMAPLSIEAVMFVLLRVRDQRAWCLAVHRCTPHTPYRPIEVALFEAVAPRLGDALGTHLALRRATHSAALLRQAQRLANLGTWCWDGHATTWSAELCALLGEAPGPRVMPKGALTARVHPEDLHQLLSALPQAKAQRTTWYGEGRLRHQSGRWIHVRAWGGFSDHEGEPQMIGVFQDITGEVEATQARERLAQRLRQAEKLQAVGELSGGIAHQFNNLLTVVLANASMLETEDDGQQVRLLGAEIQEAGLRAAALTDNMLAFGRRQALRPQPVCLRAHVASRLPWLRAQVGGTLRIELLPGEGTAPCLLDTKQLDHALLNLASNAREASHHGLLTLQIYERAAEGTVVLELTDDGDGMTEEVLARATEPFFTTRSVGEGDGLGLSMVYGFTKQSGGELHLTSEAGTGTVVALHFPKSPPPRSPS